MELITVARRDGEALACAYGCTLKGQQVRAGLLFVRAGLTRRALKFRDPTTRDTYLLKLPAKLLRLPKDGYVHGATLEVTPT